MKRVFFLSCEWSALTPFLRGQVASPRGQPDLYLPWLRYREHGYDVHVFYLGDFAPSEERCIEYEGCQIHVLSRSAFFRWRNRSSFLRLRFPADCYFLYRAAAKEGKNGAPDIIYAVQPWLSCAAFLLKRRFKAFTVKHIFGTWLYHNWTTGSLGQKVACLPHFLAWLVPADLFVLMNDGTQGDRLAEMLSIPRDRVRYWMNGVDKNWSPDRNAAMQLRQEWGVAPDALVLMCLSRLSHWKRQDRVLRAFSAVLDEVPNARFVLAGEGRTRPDLEKLAQELGVSDRVIFLGAVEHFRVRQVLGAADIFLQTNDLSCLGNSLLEAVVCGRAIITWDVGTTSDLIKDGVNGVLLPDAEPDSLAQAMIDLARDPAKREALQQGARQYALDHLQSWNERLDMEIDLVERLLAGGESRPT